MGALPTLTRYISGFVTLQRYCLVGGGWAALGVVTGGALVKLMAVIWVVVVPAVDIVVAPVVVTLVVGVCGLSGTDGGLPGLSGRAGSPGGEDEGICPVVLEGGLRGYLLWSGESALGLEVGVQLADGVWIEIDSKSVGGRVGPADGCLASSSGGLEVGGGVKGDWCVCVDVGLIPASVSGGLTLSWSMFLSLSRANRLV